MQTHGTTSFLLYTFTLFMCLNFLFLTDTAAQLDNQPASNYTFETIDVPGVDFLALTASSDFEDYAGYTRSPDGEKEVAFTLIDGVFTTYDFPGSQNTYFYALGNNGQAAGHYEDSDGLYHGVIMENGELRQYDFPNADQTYIYGISDATGALTGNYIDASGVHRGFSGDEIIEYPGASATYAFSMNAIGVAVGGYIDAEGRSHAYVRTPDGRFISLGLPGAENLEYLFVHGINNTSVSVARAKAVGDVPRTYVGTSEGAHELRVPDSVSTEGWNINQDGSIVGHYDLADGRRYGFIARLANAPVVVSRGSNYTFESIDVPGVDFLELTASSDFEDYAGNTRSPEGEKEVGFTLIDGVFTTYDFPGSQKTHFYALSNTGIAAGHYEDSDGLYHGVVLENGELRQYDFPGAVQTEIYGISDATGALTGNFIDASGVRRGFSGDTIIEYPGASATYADFVNVQGSIVGSYIDAEGVYHPYVRAPDGRFVSLAILGAENLEYLFVHGINDASISVTRAKLVGDVPRTYVGPFEDTHELLVPDSVSTEGWNINQDGSVVGNYISTDGRRHGFIARPVRDDQPVVTPTAFNYTFETIDVDGVDFLALTASSDFEDYAGYVRPPDGEKEVAFTLIDGVFTTYDFPGSQKTHFYALGNDGTAAGHYQDSGGLHHGVILENGELRQYDFPGAVQTEIYGISDATGALTGNFIDAAGVRRGFSGDAIIEFPGASATYADFVNVSGGLVGSFVDAEGRYSLYLRTPDGEFLNLSPDSPAQLEYAFIHGINDGGFMVARAKWVDDVPRTYVGTFGTGFQEFQFPGSVSTEGWNINQDGSIVGHYDSADGRRHGFIAKPPAQVSDEAAVIPTTSNYTFETIDVPGVDFLELTASNDFEDYAGNTQSPDGEKRVGFTFIDGVFSTYDFPGSQKTHFYAIGNDGTAAGHYQDSGGLHHGVILENGELRQYDFPDAVQTEIYGISDATGALTGNFIDAAGVRRGFSGDTILEFPGALATYANFTTADNVIVGSYIDAEGRYDGYVRPPIDRFLSFGVPSSGELEYLFVHDMNDALTAIARAKAVGDVPRTYVGTSTGGVREFKFPGSVSTEGWNINQDSSIVGNYMSTDGRRHGFIARPTTQTVADYFGNVYHVTLAKGLNMISVPLAPPTPMNAKSLAALTGATTVITLDTANQQFVGWTPDAPDDGFAVEGGKGYIVNVPETRQFAFVGSEWTNQTETAAAAPAISVETAQAAWAFVVSGHLAGKPAFDGHQVIVRNLRTNRVITASVQGAYFAAATADLARRSVVRVGDVIEIHVIGPDRNVESHTLSYKVTPEDLENAVLSIRLDSIGQPNLTQLLQNFPNPFNPETWIPYQLSEDSPVSLSIYDTTGKLIRTLPLGYQSAGFYHSRERAAYWDGRNAFGESVASGVYFYQLRAGDYTALRRMVILK